MILFIEPISKNIDMYVPAYPLPLIEIASYVKFNIPEAELAVISIPVDYGLPLSQEGKDRIYREFLQDLSEMRPRGVGISCTAIAQAEEVIHLCELIKEFDPNILTFLGGYFPTVYYEEIFSRTSAVDLIAVGEGEEPVLRIVERLEKRKNPINEDIPNLAWKHEGEIRLSNKGKRFDLRRKALLNLELLRYPQAYDVLPYAFSRGCPYRCSFCMEEHIRPVRIEVPPEIIQEDLTDLSRESNAHTLLVADALFKSFDFFPFLHSLGMKVNFETRCDVLDPAKISQIADACGIIALGFESASYDTLRRMRKVRNWAHYQQYISNARAIFKEAVKHEIPIMVFMIAGYPGDTEKDLEESLVFAEELSKNDGSGGHVFKIGECHVYPKTEIYHLAKSLPDVVFDDDGVFGQNVVRQPSKDLDFETVLGYSRQIFNLSNYAPKLQKTLLDIMPFFRIPSQAFEDEMIPDTCYKGPGRAVFDAKREHLVNFRELVPKLTEKYRRWMSDQRSERNLQF